MKTNKSYAKRLKVTRKGKVIGRKPGQNHFNAKARRSKQLNAKKGVEFKARHKELSTYIPL